MFFRISEPKDFQIRYGSALLFILKSKIKTNISRNRRKDKNTKKINVVFNLFTHLFIGLSVPWIDSTSPKTSNRGLDPNFMINTSEAKPKTDIRNPDNGAKSG